MTKIMLTGGSGYIGSHTLLELAEKGEFELVVFDNFKNGHRRAVEVISQDTGQNIEIVEGDLLNYDEINQAIEQHQPELVVHFAALIEAGKSMSMPTDFFENNISGSINLVKALQHQRLQDSNYQPKIVFSSTAAVYGTTTKTKVTENEPVQPDNWYGYSKSVVEQLLQAVNDDEVPEDLRIPATALRYFNAAGADPRGRIGQDYPNPTHLITLALEAALGRREKLIVFGEDYPTPDGTCIRDYIHVQDLARAHVLAIAAMLGKAPKLTGYNLFNVGTGKGNSNLEVVKAVEKIHGKFNWEYGARRPGDPVAYFADYTKINKTLGWQPQFELMDTITHAYQWLRDNPYGFRKE